MNYVLFVHDTGKKPVWPFKEGDDLQAHVAQVEREIAELVESYTMGRVTVDLVDNEIPPPSGREDGHIFQVMCAGCLDEPLDVEDVMGACPEHESDEEDDDR